ncbi:precorrin-3B synthase [Methylosinus sp. Sm6]|nr:precorrin-3B synthase [Methylosinus sp. Sm6]MBY6241075.1 precorrin-3B synthase [Methylosinus sp. Sm6]
MVSGDGLVVRVRPRLGRIAGGQLIAVASAAQRFGDGEVQLTNRANLQIRGVAAADHPALLAELDRHGLVDPDESAERRRNVIVTPFPDEAGETARIAAALTAALADLPTLPAKFGFAVDTGRVRLLAETPADIRIERAADGGIILRADGAGTGRPVRADAAAGAAVDLARWFLSAGGVRAGRGRMAALVRRRRPPVGPEQAEPAPSAAAPTPGPIPGGHLVGFPFGAAPAAALLALGRLGDVRVTPWRMLAVETSLAPPPLDGVLLAADPLTQVSACSGAPFCPQAAGSTRDLARALAPAVPAGSHLHVAGCPKGCAHAAPADLTIVATPRGYDLVARGAAADAPRVRDLRPADLADGALFREALA